MAKAHSTSKHGMSRTPEWEAWRAMRKRCYTPTAHNYDRYGGRGVSVCDRWRESFQNFYDDLGPRPSSSHSLHRKDNNGNYEPENCEWALPSTQASNRSHPRKGIAKQQRPKQDSAHPKNFADLQGKLFGRWTVIGYHGRVPGRDGAALWFCRCKCGKERPVKAASLLSGRSQSCGCRHKEIVTALGHQRGGIRQGHLAEYAAWNQMIQRCTNPKLRNFKDYGGRGVTVCREWTESFESFLVHIGPRPSPQYSLDRIDNDGHYEPGNVRWATDAQQRSNSRHPRKFPYQGEMLSMAEIARRTGIKAQTLRFRLIIQHWSVERATSTDPAAYHNRKDT